MRIARHTLVLTALGACLGLAANALSPRPAHLLDSISAGPGGPESTCRLPGETPAVHRISVQEAAPLCVTCSAAFVDARSADEYARGHVVGALHLTFDNPSETALSNLASFKLIVVYDSDESCRQAEALAQWLIARGMTDVRVLTGAWPAWSVAGAPGASGACARCGERGESTQRTLVH